MLLKNLIVHQFPNYEFYISNNELQELTNLPETLEILECENNQLKELNLLNTIKLKELICSNNPILVLVTCSSLYF